MRDLVLADAVAEELAVKIHILTSALKSCLDLDLAKHPRNCGSVVGRDTLCARGKAYRAVDRSGINVCKIKLFRKS